MTTPEEDEAWRLIVDHYDETAELDDRPRAADVDEDGSSGESLGQREPTDRMGESPTPGPSLPQTPEPDRSTPDLTAPDLPESGMPESSRHDPAPDETFVPPMAPPAPDVPLGRRVAWAGVLGVPLLFFLTALTGQTIPGALAALLACALAAAFVYLVVSQPREPRDPWDDGSRV